MDYIYSIITGQDVPTRYVIRLVGDGHVGVVNVWPGDITEGLPPKSTEGFIAPPLSWDDKWTFIEEDGTEVRKLPKESPERQCEHRAFLVHVLKHVYVDEESEVKARKIRAYLKGLSFFSRLYSVKFQTVT